MFNNKYLTGIGKLEFLNGNRFALDDGFAGITLNYLTIHGEEDKRNLPNPIENDKFIEEFDKTWNDK